MRTEKRPLRSARTEMSSSRTTTSPPLDTRPVMRSSPAAMRASSIRISAPEGTAESASSAHASANDNVLTSPLRDWPRTLPSWTRHRQPTALSHERLQVCVDADSLARDGAGARRGKEHDHVGELRRLDKLLDRRLPQGVLQQR